MVDDSASATKFRVNRRSLGGARGDVGTRLAIKRCRKTSPDLVNDRGPPVDHSNKMDQCRLAVEAHEEIFSGEASRKLP